MVLTQCLVVLRQLVVAEAVQVIHHQHKVDKMAVRAVEDLIPLELLVLLFLQHKVLTVEQV
tara:strand:- start:1354 stop:1536 length:183 start_codon:yes stop_codon:yes gene_type:complete